MRAEVVRLPSDNGAGVVSGSAPLHVLLVEENLLVTHRDGQVAVRGMPVEGSCDVVREIQVDEKFVAAAKAHLETVEEMKTLMMLIISGRR